MHTPFSTYGFSTPQSASEEESDAQDLEKDRSRPPTAPQLAEIETMMERDEHFSTIGITGAQIVSGSGGFLSSAITKIGMKQRDICFRLGGAVEMSPAMAGVEE